MVLVMKKTNILLVDDKSENLIALEAILEDLGQNLIEARSGQEALHLVLKQDFAVILMDVQMPSMDGYETARLIRGRKQSQNIPIIFLTAINVSEESMFKGYSVGAVDYLFKPFAPEILHSKVMTFVELFQYREQEKEHALLAQSEAFLKKHTLELEEINRKLENEIAERKRVEQDLKDYTHKLEISNQKLEDFAYIASHDLQEPLRKVLAFCDRLKNKYADLFDETGQDYFNRIQDATHRMQKLINDLLSYSRVTSRVHSFQNCNLSQVIKDVISILEPRIEQCKGKVKVDDLETVEADPSQMYQLFQNLIANSLKFQTTDHAPIVKISGEKVDGNYYRIAIADNGIGFEEKYLDRIFKPFQRLVSRSDFEGTGMGLAICRQIVECHEGEITAKSHLGEGSTFFVTLPINHPKKMRKSDD